MYMWALPDPRFLYVLVGLCPCTWQDLVLSLFKAAVRQARQVVLAKHKLNKPSLSTTLLSGLSSTCVAMAAVGGVGAGGAPGGVGAAAGGGGAAGAAAAALNLISQMGDPSADNVARLRAQKRALADQKKQTQKELKNEERKRQRLMTKAKGLSATDLVTILATKQAVAKAKAKAKAKG